MSLAPYGYQLLSSTTGLASFDAVDTLWLILAAALVFFMQAGFAIVEAGFTRAKNAGNIIMKNTLDMCFATLAFIAIGCSVAFGADVGGWGFIGTPDLFLSGTDFSNGYTTGAYVLFELAFAGAATTIVSGGMAERTKFVSYCVYSIFMCIMVYPIICHWVWSGNGWLFTSGYIDFAGSTVVHMCGGITALLGAYFLGPRIGKYDKDGNPRAIPGHNLTMAALGVFILWFGWFGFNGGSTLNFDNYDSATLASEVLIITCLAAASGTIAAMITTWIRYGHPDVSFTLNGCLAGLVAICSGAAAVDYFGGIAIGAIAGVAVVFVAEFVEKKLKIDDPVGAFAVHGGSGCIGTILTAFFANPDCPQGATGLLFGGSIEILGTQLLGILAIAGWTVVLMGGLFWVIKHTIGLRATAEEELSGLDLTEHGLYSAYAGLYPDAHIVHDESELGLPVTPMAESAETAPGITVHDYSEPLPGTMKKIVVITGREKIGDLKAKMDEIGVTGMTVTYVEGYGVQQGHTKMYRGVALDSTLLPKLKAEVVVSEIPTEKVIDAMKQAIYTGSIGDGKIFVYNVEEVVRVRTGETGAAALRKVSSQ
jgi:Amt family ammonium transporter